MKALHYDANTDNFTITEIDIPKLLPNDVLVKPYAAALNPVDAKIHLWHTYRPASPVWTVGLDVAGEIVAVGNQVKHWKQGDKVLYHGDMMRPHGGLAELSIHDADTLVPHPNINSVIAASLPCAGWTAYRALVDKLRINPNDDLYISGGSGGVGSFAIQIAKSLGVKNIIASSSPRNHDYMRSLGARHCIDYKDPLIETKITEWTDGNGISKALSTAGYDSDIAVAKLLSFEGEMLELVDIVRPQQYDDVFMRGLSFHQLSLGAAHRYGGSKAKQKLVETGLAVNHLIETQQISAPSITTLMLEQAPEQLKQMRQANSTGKYVVVF